MSFLKRLGFLSLLLTSFLSSAQDILTLSKEQSEAIFLKENLLLIAERLEIDQAEAQVLQAKLWPNPTLEIEDVNFWATKSQIETLSDELPSFGSGNFGKHQQIAASLEQLIQTAGKRKKLIALEEVSVEKSKQYFEDLLRNLKFEFRNQLTELQYLQLKIEVYQNQIESIQQLTQSYKNQLNQGYIAKGEYIRLKALELEIKKEIKDLNNEINEAQKELKSLMNLPATTQIQITSEDFIKTSEQLGLFSLDTFFERAKELRPDYKLAGLEEQYFSKLHQYEKSQRIPDLNLKVAYDRGGNILYNFVGFGLSFDLPIFDRNQGNIKITQIGIDQSRILREQKSKDLENEIVLAFQNLEDSIAFLHEIESDYESTLDTLLASYTKNFSSRNISLLEYLDFFDAYLENKEIILDARKEVNERIEEMNYVVGTDVIN